MRRTSAGQAEVTKLHPTRSRGDRIPHATHRWPTGGGNNHKRRLWRLVAPLLVAQVLALGACQGVEDAALDGRVTSVPLPPGARLAVHICEQENPDCDRWLYPGADGVFHVDPLDPGEYTITVLLETPNGLDLLTTSAAAVRMGETTKVELVIPTIPPQQGT